MKFKNNIQKTAILGFNIEGRSCIDFFLKQKIHISVFDEKEEGQFEKEDIEKYKKQGVTFAFGPFPTFEGFDTIVRSPGIPFYHHKIKEASKNGSTVTSAIGIFFNLCPCPIIGVTGTKGKGTTTSLIYEMLKKEGKDAKIGGNIGVSPLSFLEILQNDSIAVLELSSFQLVDVHKSPHVAVVLIVTSEHQDYHRGVDEYIDAKARIVKYQGKDDIAVLCNDYDGSRQIAQHTKSQIFWYSIREKLNTGCFINHGMIIWQKDSKQDVVGMVSDIKLPGKHNWENVCAAVAAAKALGVSNESIKHVVSTFAGLPHRLEFVRKVNDVSYYDDSFSTTPETAIAAIEAFDVPKILILGGSSKGSDFTELGNVIQKHQNDIRAIIGIGIEWQRIKEALKKISNFKFQISNYTKSELRITDPEKLMIVEGCSDMEEIINAVSTIAQPGDVALLSPACASFGMFANYKERGEQFKKEVNAL